MALNYHMDILTKGDIQEGGKISIPSYQRGIVWKLKHKKEFLESVKAGDPIGVVLIYKEADGKYTLIDGLQRLSTIKAYMANPLAFIDEKDKFINESLIENIIREKHKSQGLNPPNEASMSKQKKQFKKKLLELMKDKDMPEPEDIWKELAEELEYPSTFDVVSQFLKFYRAFQKNLKLDDDVKVQAIVYDGEKDNLPTVFHNLNTGSVSLTKYEVFASIWPKTKIIFDDEEILQKVIDKYANLKTNSNFEVEVTEDDLRSTGLTLFEYCYSLSEILKDSTKSYSYLFDNGAEKQSTDPIGFDMLALVCGLPVNKAQTLCEDAYLNGSSAVFLVNLKNAIVDCVTEVAEALKNWLFDYHGNNLKNDNLYQIYHMVMAVFKNRYTLDLTTKTISKRTDNDSDEWIENFRKYAFKHYLNDVVSSYWTINRQVSDLKRDIEDNDKTNKYTFDVLKDAFKKNLEEYLEDSIVKATGKTADLTTKLLLNYFYKLKDKESNVRYFKKEDEVNEGDVLYTFDIEHIVPKDKFERFADKVFAKSFIGNLCYLSIKDNRSKREKTLYEYADERPALTLNENFVKFINYPTREELSFINCDYESFKAKFDELMKTRSESIVLELTDLIVRNIN